MGAAFVCRFNAKLLLHEHDSIILGEAITINGTVTTQKECGIVNIKNHFHTRVNSKTCTGIICAKHLKNGFNWYVYVVGCWFVLTLSLCW